MISKDAKITWEIVLPLSFALLVFISKMGVGVLNPTEIDWLMTSGSDWTPDYMAWLYYRQAEWHFPIGLFYGYSFPEPVSVGLTGAIPLLAVPFKVLHPILPETFQYFGWWLLACYMLQAFWGYKLLQAIGVRDRWVRALGACFLVLSYSMLDRIAHMNLCAHWIVLAGMYVYFAIDDRRAWWMQGILIAISIWTHPYLIVFTVLIAFTHFFKIWIKSKSSILASLMYGIGAMSFAAAAWFLIGNHVLESDQALGDGFGIYSANLNTFFTPKTDGPIMKALPRYYETQFEGVAYLGIGTLIFFLFLPFLVWRDKINVKPKVDVIPILVLATGLFILALSHIVTLNQHLLITISLPDVVMEKLSIFRSSGRYVWLLQYLIMVGVVWMWDRIKLAKKWKYVAIIATIVVNVIDFWPQIERNILTVKAHPVVHGFHQAAWERIIGQSEEFMMYPAHERIYDKYGDDMIFAEIAGRHGKDFNSGHLARFDYNLRMEYQGAQRDSLYFEPELLSRRTVVSSRRFLKDLDKFIGAGNHWLVELDEYFVMLPKVQYVDIEDVKSAVVPNLVEKTISLEKEYFKAFTNRNKEHFLLLAVMDDASEYLENCPEIQAYFNSLNSQFNSLSFRGSYAGIIKQNELWKEKISDSSMVTIDTSVVLKDGEKISVEISSAGHDYGNEARIFVEQKNYAVNDRGLNIVVLDSNGRVIESTFFDTYMLCHHFTEKSELAYKVWRIE